ncbi:hypothetical protein SADUNF_Sadunf19G0113800 [Salix dunnii]|uniref:Uncharacterized protein n=1 Tax=Salix dunnii TaxID=1413687 RepID=A0A835J2C5_9ROSI|nr:hypothetical protein SADUNF_Sadunf19G0113800 [Salix dunnii]
MYKIECCTKIYQVLGGGKIEKPLLKAENAYYKYSQEELQGSGSWCCNESCGTDSRWWESLAYWACQYDYSSQGSKPKVLCLSSWFAYTSLAVEKFLLCGAKVTTYASENGSLEELIFHNHYIISALLISSALLVLLPSQGVCIMLTNTYLGGGYVSRKSNLEDTENGGISDRPEDAVDGNRMRKPVSSSSVVVAGLSLLEYRATPMQHNKKLSGFVLYPSIHRSHWNTNYEQYRLYKVEAAGSWKWDRRQPSNGKHSQIIAGYEPVVDEKLHHKYSKNINSRHQSESE